MHGLINSLPKFKLNSLHTGYLLLSADLFFKIHFFQRFFHKLYHSDNSLDPDQGRNFVGPDLGPTFVQWSAAGAACKGRVYHIPRDNQYTCIGDKLMGLIGILVQYVAIKSMNNDKIGKEMHLMQILSTCEQ